MNYPAILERFKSAMFDLRRKRSNILFVLATSLLVIAWILAPKTVLPEILSFLLTVFTVLLLPGLWILWAAPDLDGGDWLKRIPLAFTISYALWSIPIFVIMRLHATWEVFTSFFSSSAC